MWRRRAAMMSSMPSGMVNPLKSAYLWTFQGVILRGKNVLVFYVCVIRTFFKLGLPQLCTFWCSVCKNWFASVSGRSPLKHTLKCGSVKGDLAECVSVVVWAENYFSVRNWVDSMVWFVWFICKEFARRCSLSNPLSPLTDPHLRVCFGGDQPETEAHQFLHSPHFGVGNV